MKNIMRKNFNEHEKKNVNIEKAAYCLDVNGTN